MAISLRPTFREVDEVLQVGNSLEDLSLSTRVNGFGLDPTYCPGARSTDRLSRLRSKPYRIGYFRNYDPNPIIIQNLFFTSIQDQSDPPRSISLGDLALSYQSLRTSNLVINLNPMIYNSARNTVLRDFGARNFTIIPTGGTTAILNSNLNTQLPSGNYYLGFSAGSDLKTDVGIREGVNLFFSFNIELSTQFIYRIRFLANGTPLPNGIRVYDRTTGQSALTGSDSATGGTGYVGFSTDVIGTHRYEAELFEDTFIGTAIISRSSTVETYIVNGIKFG